MTTLGHIDGHKRSKFEISKALSDSVDKIESENIFFLIYHFTLNLHVTHPTYGGVISYYKVEKGQRCSRN